MPSRIDLVKIWFHPRTGKRLSQAKAKAYNRRAKKRIKPQLWLVQRFTVGETKGLDPRTLAGLKKRAGQIGYMARLTRTEAIVRTSTIKDRKVRQTLANHRVFKKLWDDFEVQGDIQRRGSIRIAVSGNCQGRRVKHIIHLAFVRSHWIGQFHSEARAYEEFKHWLTAAILSNLRRRKLRVSNPIESAGRVNDLTKNRQGMLNMLDMETREAKKGGWMERITWATKAIAAQKKTRQLTQATMKIDKLI